MELKYKVMVEEAYDEYSYPSFKVHTITYDAEEALQLSDKLNEKYEKEGKDDFTAYVVVLRD